MGCNPIISIIICSCNRAAALRATLEALGNLSIPRNWNTEIILVDNASTDDTATITRNAKFANATVRFLSEPKSGKGYALNSGLAAARGEVILFTDDDVRPAEDWVEQLASPLLHGECDAAVGKTMLAPHLLRPWLTTQHKGYLACLESPPPWPLELIGVNMGFRSAVLERVAGFDPELAPGGLGLGEDSLFSGQVSEAGFRLKFVERAVIVHHPDASRLLRSEWLSLAEKMGRRTAYLDYHWKHQDITVPRLKWLFVGIMLFSRRIVQPAPPLEAEGCSLWEMGCVGRMAMYKQFCIERRRPRNYAPRGLTKLAPAHFIATVPAETT